MTGKHHWQESLLIEADYTSVFGFYAYRPIINDVLCQQCGTCAQFCRKHCIRQQLGGMFRPDDKCCVGCGRCVTACPANAIPLVQVGGSWPVPEDRMTRPAPVHDARAIVPGTGFMYGKRLTIT